MFIKYLPPSVFSLGHSMRKALPKIFYILTNHIIIRCVSHFLLSVTSLSPPAASQQSPHQSFSFHCKHYNSSDCSFIFFFSRTKYFSSLLPHESGVRNCWPSVISWTLKLIHTNWKYHAKIFLFSVLHPQEHKKPLD